MATVSNNLSNTTISIKKLIAHLALALRALSDWLIIQADYQIITTPVSTPTKPYTGPTYCKLANSTRQLIAGKIAHEKGYTSATGWLYLTIAGLIDRRTNNLTISQKDLAIETGISEQAIITHTVFLETMGIISVDRSKSGPKSNEVNTYQVIGDGADVVLWNGNKLKLDHPKILTTPPKNFDRKDSFKMNQIINADAADKKENASSTKIELSKDQQAAVNALKSVKISAKIARELAIKHADELERLFATIKCAQVSNKLDSPAGFVIDELRHNKQDLSFDIVKDAYETLDDYISIYLPKSPDDYKPVGAHRDVPDVANGNAVPRYLYDTPAGPQTKPLPPVPDEFQEQWDITYNQLELQFDRATFETWLKGAKIIAIEDGTFVIGVRNGYVRDMLQHRLYRNIRRVLSDVRGDPTELRFEVVEQPKQIKREDDMPLFKQLTQETS